MPKRESRVYPSDRFWIVENGFFMTLRKPGFERGIVFPVEGTGIIGF